MIWICIVASFALSVYASYVAPTANFFLLPTRAWELLLGAALAIRAFPAVNVNVSDAIGVLGLLLLSYAVIFFSKASPFPGVNALFPCLGSVFLIYAGSHPDSRVAKLMGARPLVGIGLISYSLYLVHWPIIVFVRYATLESLTAWQGAAVVVVSIILAIIMWRFVEQPFRKLKPALPQIQVMLGSTVMLAALAVALAGVVLQGAPGRFRDLPARAENHGNPWREGKCFFLLDQDFRAWNAKDCGLSSANSTAVLLWGDSFAAHYAPGVEANADLMTVNVLQYTAAGCPPVLNFFSHRVPMCSQFNQHALDIIRKHNIKFVILAARWSELERRGFEMLTSSLEAMRNMGVEVWVIGQSVEFPASAAIISFRKGRGPYGTDMWPPAVSKDINVRLRKYSSDARFIDPLQYLCNQGECLFQEHGVLLYEDYGHFSSLGSSRAVKYYFPFLDRDGLALSK